MSKLTAPINLHKWVEEHRHLLKPPVGNKKIWEDNDFIIFAVGGPNARKDYHINPTEEFFYQLEGDIVVKVITDSEFRDVPIREGEIFLLPANIPHSPQRAEGSVGLVIEYKRPAGENDGLVWYCDNCRGVVHKVQFELEDIVSQLKAVIEEFWASEDLRTCKACNTMLQK